MRLLDTDFIIVTHFNSMYFTFSYPLLSTGWDPVISGAIGSLYTADVPSIVTETLTPSERGTGKNKNNYNLLEFWKVEYTNDKCGQKQS